MLIFSKPGLRRLGHLVLLATGLGLTSLVAGCDNDAYNRGFESGRRAGERTGYETGYAAGQAEGEKAGRSVGYADGKIQGYASGTVEIVGAHYQPSLALGICVGIAFLAALTLGSILAPPAAALAEAVVSFGRNCGQHLLVHRLGRRSERRQARMRAEHAAFVHELAKLSVVGALRATGRQLVGERLDLAVESFLQSALVNEFAQELQLSIQAFEEARAAILKNPDLSPAARADLLERLSAQLQPLDAPSLLLAN